MARKLAASSITANQISVLGMVAGLFAGVLMLATNHLGITGYRAAWFLAAVCVQLRLLANMLDGMVAIAQDKASPVGELYNEVPDRVSDTLILLGLGYAVGGSIEWGYLACIFAMFTAYVRATGKGAGTKSEFCGPMAKPHRMFATTVACVYCAVTPLPLQSFFGFGIPAITLILITVGSAWTTARRLNRIAAQLRAK